MKPARLPILSWMIALLVSVSLTSPRAAAQDVGEKVYKSVLKSIAWVLVPIDKTKSRTGTATLVDAHRRLLLTNYHVVGDRDEAIALFPVMQKNKVVAEKDFYRQGLKKLGIPGKVIARDKKRDLALIELASLPPGVVPLTLAAASPSPGQEVHSVGNPGASDGLWVYTRGTVRQVLHQKWKSTTGKGGEVFDLEAEVVMTQSPINPGDSGGPLVNGRGELVGVTQGVAVEASQLSLFIDVSEARTFLTSKKVALKSGAPATGRALADSPRPTDPPKPADDSDLMERRAASKLRLAGDLAANGKKDRAVERLEELIRDYPNTKAAEEAKQLLPKLKK